VNSAPALGLGRSRVLVTVAGTAEMNGSALQHGLSDAIELNALTGLSQITLALTDLGWTTLVVAPVNRSNGAAVVGIPPPVKTHEDHVAQITALASAGAALALVATAAVAVITMRARQRQRQHLAMHRAAIIARASDTVLDVAFTRDVTLGDSSPTLPAKIATVDLMNAESSLTLQATSGPLDLMLTDAEPGSSALMSPPTAGYT